MSHRSVRHFFKELVVEYGEYRHGQAQNLILPSWILGMGVCSDIFTTLTLVGFIF